MAGVVYLQPHQVQIYSGGFSVRERGSGQPAKISGVASKGLKPATISSRLPRSLARLKNVFTNGSKIVMIIAVMNAI